MRGATVPRISLDSKFKINSGVCSLFIFHVQLLSIAINSLSGVTIPEVFLQCSSQCTLLSLHIKMSNTLTINYFPCQAHVSLELRLLGPNHFSPQVWQKCKVRGGLVFKRKNIPPWKITLSKSGASLGSPDPSGLLPQHGYKTRCSISSILDCNSLK